MMDDDSSRGVVYEVLLSAPRGTFTWGRNFLTAEEAVEWAQTSLLPVVYWEVHEVARRVIRRSLRDWES